MFERGDEPAALVGVMAQPMQQFGETPFRRVGAPAPLDRLEIFIACLARDLLRLRFGAVVTPKIIVVERLEARTDGNDARTRRVDGERHDILAGDGGVGERTADRTRQGGHMVGMRLRRVVGIVAAAMQGIVGGGIAEAAALFVDERHTHVQGSEIDARHDGHAKPSLD